MHKTTWLLAAIASAFLGGCMVGGSPDSTTEGDVSYSQADLREPVWFNGKQLQIVFPGSSSQNTEYYYFWNIGTNGTVNATYDTAKRLDIYAVFGVVIPNDQAHHVDGFEAYDHYHVMEGGPTDTRYNGTWDLKVVFPGPNYDAATYVTAHSKAELDAQVAAGILGPIQRCDAVGFSNLVFFAPIVN